MASAWRRWPSHTPQRHARAQADRGLRHALRFALAIVVVLGRCSEASLADPLIEPMHARNLSPPIAIFGVPTWDGGLDADDTSRIFLSGDIASHFRFAAAGTETLILDGETWRADIVYERRIARDWTVAVEVPIVHNSGGVLDDFIDAWHSAFNLPDGNRNTRPEDELQFFYDPGPGSGYFRREAGTAFGDVVVGISRTVGQAREWLISLDVKLPTGDEALLAGSGAADAAISVLRRGALRSGRRPFGWYWGASLLRLGELETFPAQNKDWVGLAMGGFSWQVFPSVGLKAQLDAHTAFYESALEELGDPAAQATFGGWWSIDASRTLTVAVIEDLIVRAAPDVSLQVAFQWEF